MNNSFCSHEKGEKQQTSTKVNMWLLLDSCESTFSHKRNEMINEKIKTIFRCIR